jgi:hypothetical protein
VVDAASALSARALQLNNAIQAPVLPGNYGTLPAQAQTFHTNRVNSFMDARTRVVNGDAAVQAAVVQIRILATNAAANPTNAATVRLFTDAVTDLVIRARQTASAAKELAKTVNAQMQTQAQALDAGVTAFDQFGPAVSDKKTSTLAPATWSDEDILAAGAETAAETPLLVDQAARPNTGDHIRTKHQKVINNVVWVAIKRDVTFTDGAVPTFTGGVQTSSWPLGVSVIPPAVNGVADGDGFYPL